ncbi:Protein LURP-one-related like [Quillaja saponaria]|uniref:Protein LURP-one-related like n=1 Tax=Quillaja saponaria TaxID=32244 RepID=A0AAD7L5E1_QUISA|nr:Protein LURP-one-related like [Quillaja saponaria]
MNEGLVVDYGFVFNQETIFTVLKTSLFFSGDGFTVFDCNGQLVFRVDSYGPDSRHVGEVVLMDGHGSCLLTVRRKRPSLHQRWEGFQGEGIDGTKPMFSVRRSSIIGRSTVTVEVNNNPGEDYQVEGSFAKHCCTILNANRESVAEIRRKVDASTSVMLGNDVFSLTLKPGFDGAFAMGLVLVLDQINADDFVNDGIQVDSITEE